jgi:hypothetical protein
VFFYAAALGIPFLYHEKEKAVLMGHCRDVPIIGRLLAAFGPMTANLN